MFKKYGFTLINLATVLFLLVIPYYIFEGKMYLGGDDTRLFYSYPIEFLTNAAFFSWNKVSTIGTHGPSQYIVPFISAWSIIAYIIEDKVVLNYLAFSTPLILGFIFFQRSIDALFNLKGKNSMELYLGSLFYVLSPILVFDQMFIFLISIWLLALIPIVTFYFIRYLSTSDFKYVFIASLWSILLSFALYAVPWLAGFVLPIIIGLVSISILFKFREIFFFLKHLFVFLGFILVSQAFWLVAYLSLYIDLGQESFASKFTSKAFVDTFTPTILSTATGDIIYPLLNLFHRQIAFDFVWKLKNVYVNFYDSFFIINSIYIAVFAFGVLRFRMYLSKFNTKIYIFLLVSFFLSLYFFTVNIGPLKEAFILLGQIPGFTMFRNFYDKFAPGYVIFYSALISISLIMLSKRFPAKRALFLLIFFIVTAFNFIPAKEIVNSPLWTTNNVYKTVNIPKEYIDFMESLKKEISTTNVILSIPFGSSVYTVVKDENSQNNAYVGVSPVKIFSDISDISGHLSFNFTDVGITVDSLIIERDYEKFNELLFSRNINYVLVTNNIPSQVLDSYIFSKDLLKMQDHEFMSSIASRKITESSFGNYELYETKKINSLINSRNVYFKKINQVKYDIYLKALSKKQFLEFVDSYHGGWKLYINENPSLDFCSNPKSNIYTGSIECREGNNLFELSDLNYIFLKPVFDSSHDTINDFANRWEIDPDLVKNSFDKSYYVTNPDGTIDIKLTLYFEPQTRFYIGLVVSFVTLAIGIVYLVNRKWKK